MVPGISLSVYDIREHTTGDDGVEKRQASEYVSKLLEHFTYTAGILSAYLPVCVGRM